MSTRMPCQECKPAWEPSRGGLVKEWKVVGVYPCERHLARTDDIVEAVVANDFVYLSELLGVTFDDLRKAFDEL